MQVKIFKKFLYWKVLIIIAALGVVLFVYASNSPSQELSAPRAAPLYSQPLTVGNKKIMVQIVSNNADMQKGLSGRKKLSDGQGMLFDFKKLYELQRRPSTDSTDSRWQDGEQGRTTSSGQNVGKPTFWMKDMKFDLDLIWINNKKIVGITADVPAPVNCQSSIVNCSLPTYSPPQDVDMVLEVNAGWSERNNIITGDKISF